MVAKRLLIAGRVQGVGFREALRAEARRHGIAGWVRNLSDGKVEALLQGPEEAVHAVAEWARRGPALAKVAAVRIETLSGAVPAHFGFEVRPTE